MKSSFNAGWLVRPKQSLFLELTGGGTPPEAVTLPHDAMIGTARDPAASSMNAYFPGGVWEYTTSFAVPEQWRSRRVHLQFEGVYRDATVFVNDDFAAAEPYGYGEFVVDLDPFLRYGVDNVVKVECRAGDDARWYSGAGIFRPVHLWVQSPVRLAIDGVWVTTPEIDGDGAVVEVTAEVCNDTAHTVTTLVEVELRDPDGAVVGTSTAPVTVRPRATAMARQRLYVSAPRCWSPDHPHLYSCATTLSRVPGSGAAGSPDGGPIDGGPIDGDPLDADSTWFGIRRLQLDPKRGLRINGEVVKLRGACVHHDNGPIGAATIARAEERRVEGLKAAGFNALRSAHNPMSRAMLDACDRHGVVVMDEAWDVWTEPKRDHDHALRFDARWRADLAAMVRKDRNHPCVVLYSTGNEIPEVGSPLGAARAREIAEHVRSLDPTRYVTNAVQPLLAIRDFISKIRDLATGGALEGGGASADAADAAGAAEVPEQAGVNTMMASWAQIKDRLLGTPLVSETMEQVCASLDVAGYNYLDVRYQLDGEQCPNRVIVGSETYVTAFARSWPLIEAAPHVIGDFTWTGWDYLGEVGIGRVEHTDASDGAAGGAGANAGISGAYPWLVAHAGDIDITGERRPASYFREIVLGLRTDPYMAVVRPRSASATVAYSGPWSWSDSLASWTWEGHEGTGLRVEVYAAAEEVEVLCNGRSFGRQPAGPAREFTATFTVPYEPGELTAVAFASGREVGRAALRTAEGSVRLAAHADRSALRADDTDLAHVAVTLVDGRGTVHPGVDREVTVAIDGPAVLQGFASADPKATTSFRSATCPTYEGKALAVIRPSGVGAITVRFSAADLDPVTCVLEAERA